MMPKTPAIAAPNPTTAAEGRDPTASAVELLAAWPAARVASDDAVVAVLVVRVRVAGTTDVALESALPTASVAPAVSSDVADAELLSVENDESVALDSSAPVLDTDPSEATVVVA